MEVYALVGASGTGKSYRSTSLAAEKDIGYIIDDGILIRGNKIVAGISAKKEETKVAAVRRALFLDTGHAESTMEAIRLYKPDKLLILGTSENMIRRIAKNLGLESEIHFTYIDDISTPRDIRIARKMRMEEGKHVIPVPTFEVKKDFSGYFIHPLKIFRKSENRNIQIAEKTVVRPTFSYMGRYYISDSAIEAIAVYNCRKVEQVSRIYKTEITTSKEGIVIALDVVLKYGGRIPEVIAEAQQLITDDVELLTGMNVLKVNFAVKALTL